MKIKRFPFLHSIFLSGLILLFLLAACSQATPTNVSPTAAPMQTNQSAAPTMEVKNQPTATQEIKSGVVYSLENDGPGSLRQMVLNASSGDVITFDTNLFNPDQPGVIKLKEPISFMNGDITVDASDSGVVMDGEGGPEVGFIIQSDNNHIQGIKFTNFSATGIIVDGENKPDHAKNNVIGGDRSMGEGPYGEGNCFINNGMGVTIQRGASGNTVKGNLIGIDLTDEAGGNQNGGVLIQAGANGNTIGPANVIANNHDLAIKIEGSERITITQNSIYDNLNGVIGRVNCPNPDIKFEPQKIACSSGMVMGDLLAPKIERIEVFSGDESGMKNYETMIDVANLGKQENGNLRIPLSVDTGKAFTGGYLYFSGIMEDGNTTNFSIAAKCETGLNEVAKYLEKPLLVWGDTFDTVDNVPTWETEFPNKEVDGKKVVDGHFVFASTDSEWRIAKLNNPLINYLNDAKVEGSQAVSIIFKFNGESKFRIQASVHPQDKPGYLYETGINFDPKPQRFISSPDAQPPLEDMQGSLQIKENVYYQYVMGIDNSQQKFIVAIWEKGKPENALTYSGDIATEMSGQPWNFVMFGFGKTQIRLDEIQILSFGK